VALRKLQAEARLDRVSSGDVDRHVCQKMRERRIMLGLTQQQVAELIGVTCQQAHKYETGIHRIAAGHLFAIAQALSVDVNYFVDGMNGQPSPELTRQQRALMDLARNFIIMPRRHQDKVSNMARSLANLAPDDDVDDEPPREAGAI
jgi:transcriptional regulator with XRE-family HTH domain